MTPASTDGIMQPADLSECETDSPKDCDLAIVWGIYLERACRRL
jgi:hypothetical protein